MLFCSKTDKRLFVPCRLLTKVPSVTVMWIFVASLDHRSLYACVAGAQTDTSLHNTYLLRNQRKDDKDTLQSICCTKIKKYSRSNAEYIQT